MGRGRYTFELLAPVVAEADSYADVLRRLGLAQAGGTQAHVARRIRSLGIDTSHFTRRRYASPPIMLTTEEIFAPIPVGDLRRKPHQLKRALLAIGRVWECALCGNDGMWCDRALTLHVDHIDGDFHNNDPDNLRFLCPNCHSQTPNFAGRSKGWRSRRQK